MTEYFYKNEHKKYKFFAGSGCYFEFYNEIAKNDLPIKYMFNPKNDALECGWFVFDKTLLIPDSMVEYRSDVEKWFCSEYGGGHDVASIPLDEYLQQEIATINELLEYNTHPNYEEKIVSVIGGGNVVMDCARTIKRLRSKRSKYYI